ncbi:hypothetical protein EJB05_43852, partial [Eragrostis curvula]
MEPMVYGTKRRRRLIDSSIETGEPQWSASHASSRAYLGEWEQVYHAAPNRPAYFAQRNNELERTGSSKYSNNTLTLTVLEGRALWLFRIVTSEYNKNLKIQSGNKQEKREQSEKITTSREQNHYCTNIIIVILVYNANSIDYLPLKCNAKQETDTQLLAAAAGINESTL